MYPIDLLRPVSSWPEDSLPGGGITYAEDVADWAWQQGMGLGQNGLNPGWALDSGNNFRPTNPKDPYAQIMWNIYYTEYYDSIPGPPYLELQTIASATQDCYQYSINDLFAPYFNSLSCTPLSQASVSPPGAVTGASWAAGTATVYAPNSLIGGQSVFVSGIQSSVKYGYDGTFNVVGATSTYFTYSLVANPGNYTSGGWASPATGPFYDQCAGIQVTLNTYLAQLYGDVTTLETYYNDLDNTNPTVEAVYSDWLSQTTPNNLTTYENEYYAPSHDGYCPGLG